MDDGIWPPKPKAKPSPRALSAEERELWAQWTQSVAPLPKAARAPKQSLRHEEGAALTHRVQPQRRSPHTAPAHSARPKGATDATIDLHGLTVNQAHDRLLRFLELAQRQDMTRILVITGKGGAGSLKVMEPGERMDAHRPRAQGLLRSLLPLWLKERQFQPLVHTVEQAPPRLGGAGAWIVRLRRNR